MKKHLLSKAEISEILDRLKDRYPEAGCALNYNSKFNLLIAVVLSAQTTDVSVNKITPILFSKYPDAKALAEANELEVQDIIRPIGLYKNKTSNIIKLSKALVDRFDGVVPGNYDELVSLPGVGRKTANVVLSEGFGVQRIAVDTHVFRVSNRIGLADAEDVLKTEKMLMENLPDDRWSESHHLLIFHGRNICKARNPLCNECPIKSMCASRELY